MLARNNILCHFSYKRNKVLILVSLEAIYFVTDQLMHFYAPTQQARNTYKVLLTSVSHSYTSLIESQNGQGGKGPLEGIWSKPCAQAGPLRTMSRRLLNISKDGDSTTSLGNLCQCSAPHTVKKCSLMFSWKSAFKDAERVCF